MANTATRLITLIMLLQRRPNQQAASLAKELGVSVRTLHRYFGMIEELGIPIYTERGPYGGFSLVRGYKMPPLIFTPEEAVAVYLGTRLVDELWGQLYQDASRGAAAKLENVLPDEQRHEVAWARRALLATGFHRGDVSSLEPLLETLRQATHEHRQVKMLYQSRGQTEPAWREVEPYAMIHRWGLWYMVGYCHLRKEVRSFRVDRMIRLELLKQTFEMPAGFDIHAYLAAESIPQPRFDVRVRFSRESAGYVREYISYWGTIEEQPDGSIMAALNLFEIEYAARFLLGFGLQVEVLEPPELRQKIAEMARSVADKYQNNL